MTGDFDWNAVGERAYSIRDIAALVVERGEILAQVDDENVHLTRSKRAAEVLGFAHQQRAQSTLLNSRIDRQETEVGFLAAHLDVDAAGDLVAGSGYEKSAL